MPRSTKLVHSTGLKEALGEQADYQAAKRQTKLRPKPRGIRPRGSTADWHFRRESDHLWVGELGREYDRNTPVGTRLLNVLVNNVLQDKGFQYNPNTGDDKLDADLKARIDDLFYDPAKIDIQGEYNFFELTKMVLRDELAAGDIFGLFNADGPIELRESHQCRQPFNKGTRHKNNVLGVELTEERKRLGFWFINQPISPLDGYRVRQSDLDFVPAWDLSTDWPTRNVLHVRDATRITQTRGVSLFAPVFDYLGMFEDSQWQQLVKSQLSNMMMIVRERGAQYDPKFLGKRMASGVESQMWGENDRLIEELYPGAELQGFPDEKISPWSPNIPNSEWFDHMKLVVRVIGIAWNIPYVLMMLDTADTNFHGYRGALVEARETFRGMQRRLAARWHTPVLVHYLHRMADEDPVLGRARERTLRHARQRRQRPTNIFQHSWTLPGWPSVDDLKDAQADLIRLSNSITSRRKLAERQDIEVEEMNAHIVEGNLDLMQRGNDAAIEEIVRVIEVAAASGIDIPIESVGFETIELIRNQIAPMPFANQKTMAMTISESNQSTSEGNSNATDDSSDS